MRQIWRSCQLTIATQSPTRIRAQVGSVRTPLSGDFDTYPGSTLISGTPRRGSATILNRSREVGVHYRTLGGSGCAVSTYALGTMTFGNETDEPDSHAQLDRFVEVGGTLVDTADVYTAGTSERFIGSWLDKRGPAAREQIVLATKGRFPTGRGPNDRGLSRNTSSPHWTPRCAGSVSIRSTSTSCTRSTRTHRWRKRCPSWTTRSARARCTTSDCRTSPAGSCSAPWTSPSSTGSPRR